MRSLLILWVANNAGDSTILVERILDPAVLDDDKGNFRAVQQIIKTTAPWASAWVGEAGGAYNSGKHLVSNAFVMSFWSVIFFHFQNKQLIASVSTLNRILKFSHVSFI